MTRAGSDVKTFQNILLHALHWDIILHFHITLNFVVFTGTGYTLAGLARWYILLHNDSLKGRTEFGNKTFQSFSTQLHNGMLHFSRIIKSYVSNNRNILHDLIQP